MPSVPPAADAALMGRSEDRGRVGAAADSQDGVSLYPDPTGTLLPDGLILAIARGAARNP